MSGHSRHKPLNHPNISHFRHFAAFCPVAKAGEKLSTAFARSAITIEEVANASEEPSKAFARSSTTSEEVANASEKVTKAVAEAYAVESDA